MLSAWKHFMNKEMKQSYWVEKTKIRVWKYKKDLYCRANFQKTGSHTEKRIQKST